MRCLLPVIIPLACASLLDAVDTEPAPMPTILTKSPFLPPDFQPPGTPGQAAQEIKGPQKYEFRGVYELGGQLHFNLYSASEKKGQWITEATAEEMGLRIVDFDRETNSLKLLADGESLSLTLIETSDKPMALAQTAAKQVKPKPPTQQNRARRRVIRPTSRPQTPSTTPPQRRTVNRTPSKP